MCLNFIRLKNKILYFPLLFFILTNIQVEAARIHQEKIYQNYWCQKVCGISEYRLPQGQRVDCLTKSHAIEFDFANKVYEGIGQAIYYSVATGLKPGVVLIVENDKKDEKYLEILKIVSKYQGIDFWIIKPEDIK